MKKYPKQTKICCPMCEGKGHLEIKYQDLMPRSPYLGNQETKKIRNKLRQFNADGKLKELSLRSIGALIGITSAQQVKHHLLQLDKLGWDKMEK